MGRRRDDDDDDLDDRPVRPPKKEGGGGKTVLIILLIVGVVLLLIFGACGFFVYRAVTSVKNGINDLGDSFKADAEAQSFLGKLRTDPQSAYDSMAPSYKATTSRDQFQQLLNRNPPLTKHMFPRKTTYNPMTGTPPNRKEVVSYVTDNSFDPEPFPQPGPPKAPKALPGPKTITATLTVAEQPGGFWKVENLTVP